MKYSNIQFIENGGWHFTNIKTAKEIEYKLKSYFIMPNLKRAA